MVKKHKFKGVGVILITVVDVSFNYIIYILINLKKYLKEQFPKKNPQTCVLDKKFKEKK
jgi:hypothetical protein